MDLEDSAIALSWFDNQVVPGLLQTENYARAVFRCRVPASPEAEIEALTTRRLARQEILRRSTPPTLSFAVWGKRYCATGSVGTRCTRSSCATSAPAPAYRT